MEFEKQSEPEVAQDPPPWHRRLIQRVSRYVLRYLPWSGRRTEGRIDSVQGEIPVPDLEVQLPTVVIPTIIGHDT